jgi:hypothetical protein
MGTYQKHRANDRLKIPGASVYPCKRISHLRLIFGSIRGLTLFNINKSGICFESSNLYKKGEIICIMVKIPGEKRFFVEACVKWLEDKPESSRYYVGAQLQPFGKGKNLNSYKTLHRLRELHKKYNDSIHPALAHS